MPRGRRLPWGLIEHNNIKSFNLFEMVVLIFLYFGQYNYKESLATVIDKTSKALKNLWFV